MPFINGSFGLGDLLFFYTVSIAFPSFTFSILFMSSVFFSFVIHLIFKNKLKDETVPLAGYMALFFAIVFFTNIFFNPFHLYLI